MNNPYSLLGLGQTRQPRPATAIAQGMLGYQAPQPMSLVPSFKIDPIPQSAPLRTMQYTQPKLSLDQALLDNMQSGGIQQGQQGQVIGDGSGQGQGLFSELLTGQGSSDRLTALGASLLSGPSRTPISFGSSFAKGLLAGNQAVREANSGNLFAGKGQSAESFNMIRKLAPIIQSGRASEQQIADYKLLEQIVSKDIPQTRVDPESGATETYLVPGIDLAEIGLPSFKSGGNAQGGERMVGSKEATYTETQTKNGRFASAMYDAEKNLRLLELTEGYDPTSDADSWAQKAPGGLTGYLQSRQGQLYSQAKEQFINANLRSDSGANIAESEFRRKEAELFPVPGDTIATVEAKRKARLQQLNAMAESSGGFYTRKFGKDKPLDAFEKNTPRGSRKNPVVVASEEEGDGLPAGSIYVIGDNKILYQSEGR
jgi:hypothetical protein